MRDVDGIDMEALHNELHKISSKLPKEYDKSLTELPKEAKEYIRMKLEENHHHSCSFHTSDLEDAMRWAVEHKELFQ